MRQRALVIAVLAATFVVISAPTAGAQGFGVADTCTTPTTGTTTAPNQPCWVPGIYSGDYTGTNDTSYYTQAGGHPFTAVTDFTLATTGGVPNGNLTNVRVDVPPGLISDPQAVPQCTQANPANCSSSSQVGVVELEASVSGLPESLGASVYDMVPPTGKVSDYAFEVPLANVRTDIIGGIRSGSQDLGANVAADDGLYFTIAVPSSPAELVRSTLIFWGDPGDSAHTPDAGWSCESLSSLTGCAAPASAASHPAGTAFLTLPSGCLPAGQVSTLTLTDSSGDVAQVTGKTPVPASGCQNVKFDPSLTVTPQTTQADSPTGLKVDLHVPQDDNAGDLASSTLQTAVVTLPPGTSLDPSAANGLQACSPAQFAMGSDAAPACPTASQVGTVEIDTPLLPGPLTGSVYLGCGGASAQTPCTPASSSGTVEPSLYVYATAPVQGVVQKLLGTVATDPATGQVTTTFANQPQVPFSDLILNFNGGPTATVANPLQCGPATTTSSLTPYSVGAAASPSTTFTVDHNGAGGACPQPAPFAPGVLVKTATLQAGAFDAPFTVDVTRADQQQYLGRLTVALPPGLVGLLARVPQCSEPEASQGTCPASSRIGSTSVSAGAGTDPISQSGTAYLTGPYKGAPFGFAIVVPAIAGPFDLGTVVVRAAIDVDRTDAHVTITSDPLPQIVGGVPLRIRGVSVTIDRPGFMINPTSCAPLAIDASTASVQGATSTAASPFQATGCGSLPFSPTLTMALSGNLQTVLGGHPALTATVSSGLGQANVRAASVTLPLSLALDPNNSANVCSVADSDTDSCPADTVIGNARVTTPVLSQPLTGNVYLVQGIRINAQGQQVRTLPSLLIPLRGQLAIDLRGQTSVDSDSRLVTTFPTVPDAAISSFALTINGGRHGILVVTGNAGLCRGRQLTTADFIAQSGSTKTTTTAIAVPCARRVSLARLQVIRHAVRVLIRVPSPGSVTVSGAGLRTQRRRIARPRVMWLTVQLTRQASARLGHQGKLRLQPTIRYTPAGWPPQTIATRTLTMRR